MTMNRSLPHRDLIPSCIVNEQPKLLSDPLTSPDVSSDCRDLMRVLYRIYAEDCLPDLLEVDEAAAIEAVHKMHMAGEIEMSQRVRPDGEDGILIERTRWYDDYLKATWEVGQWLTSPLVLQRAGGSRFHKLSAEFKAGTMSARPGDKFPLLSEFVAQGSAVFVVEHNWAEALKSAEIGAAPEVKLPFERCVFEFNVSNRRLCALAGENSGGINIFVQTSLGWQHFDPVLMTYAPGFARKNFADDAQGVEISELQLMINEQVNGALIALDSAIAETEVIRAPEKLNKAREKRGRSPIPDYSVIKLSTRHHSQRLPAASGESGRRVRLHFRRGHWRRFEDHKTWINWTLVGDPDLGFIEKHYRL